MRSRRYLLIASICIPVLGAVAWSQAHKLGLWEVTSNMTWQQWPLPPGMAPQERSSLGGGKHVSKVCVAKDDFDKFGALPPQADRYCQVSNVVHKLGGMTADLTCAGPMTGSGTIVGSWDDDSHGTSKVHFTGSMQMGSNAAPVEWTNDSTWVFKDSDCGSVKTGIAN